LTVTTAIGDDVEQAQAGRVTADFLLALDVTPMLGRHFLPDEDRPGGNTRVLILSHGFWQRQFGGDAAAIGKTLPLNETSYTVVGVLPPSFAWGVASPVDLFMPLAADPAQNRGDHRLSA